VKVGVNYPWYDYGWDFGEVPWRKDAEPAWATLIDTDLDYFRDLGITVVRWFVLGDGLTYGTGERAPYQDKAGTWRFDDPPKLSDTFLRHFRKLLERFASANQKSTSPIQLLPVLLDFRFCLEGYDALRKQPQTTAAEPAKRRNWIRCGRSDVVVDPSKSEKFYDGALAPLLDISKGLRSTIFAWDVFNEPEWVTTGWHPYGARDLPISEQRMREFLSGAIERIQNADFKTTVGFWRIETIGRSKLSCGYNQFHHYPDEKRTLARNPFPKDKPGMVGEFGTATIGKNQWPELGDKQSVCDRLKKIDGMGYPFALPWAVMTNDDHTSWGEGEEGIKAFFSGLPCPPRRRS
jgi:hypothetical protein